MSHFSDEEIEQFHAELVELESRVDDIVENGIGTPEERKAIVELIVAIGEYRGFNDGDDIRKMAQDRSWDELVEWVLSQLEHAQEEYELTRYDHYANREPRERLKAGFDDALIDVVADEIQARYGWPDFSNSSDSRYWEFGRYKVRLSDHPLPTYYDLPTLDIRVAPQLDADAHLYLRSPCTDEELESFIEKVFERCDHYKALAEAEEEEDDEEDEAAADQADR